jgi:hypothetical protein
VYVQVGNISFDSGTVEWTASQRPTFDARGLPAQYLLKVDLNGQLQGTSTANIFQQVAALRAACNRQFQDVVLRDDNGTILEGLRNATSLTGVRITGPDFPDGKNAQGVTVRSFTLSAEATYPGVGHSNQLVLLTQRVTKTGGGPLYSFLQPKKGKPVKVMEASNTPFTATQQGSAQSLIPNPTPRAPIWPGALMRDPEVTYDDPVFDNGRWVYGVSWSYVFGSTTPLR